MKIDWEVLVDAFTFFFSIAVYLYLIYSILF